MAKKTKFNMKLIVGGIIFVIVIVAIGYYLSRKGSKDKKTNTRSSIFDSITGALGAGEEHFTDSPVITSRCQDMTCVDSLNDTCGLRFVGNVLFKPVLKNIFEKDYAYTDPIFKGVSELNRQTISASYNKLDGEMTAHANDFFRTKNDCIKKYYKPLVDLWNSKFDFDTNTNIFVFETEIQENEREDEVAPGLWTTNETALENINKLVREINNLTSNIEVIDQNIKQYLEQQMNIITEGGTTDPRLHAIDTERQAEVAKKAIINTEKETKEALLEQAKCDINSCTDSSTEPIVTFDGDSWASIDGTYSSDLGLNDDEWEKIRKTNSMIEWTIRQSYSTHLNFLSWGKFQFIALLTPYEDLQKINVKVPDVIDPSFLIFSELRSDFVNSHCDGSNKETDLNNWIQFMANSYDSRYPGDVNKIKNIFNNVTLLLSLFLFQFFYKQGVFLDEDQTKGLNDISRYVLKNYMEVMKESTDDLTTDTKRPHYSSRIPGPPNGNHFNPFLELAILRDLRKNLGYNEDGEINRSITDFKNHRYRTRPNDANYFHTELVSSNDDRKPRVFLSNKSIFSFMMCFKMDD